MFWLPLGSVSIVFSSSSVVFAKLPLPDPVDLIKLSLWLGILANTSLLEGQLFYLSFFDYLGEVAVGSLI